MIKLKQIYQDAGGAITFASTLCKALACVIGAIVINDYLLKALFIFLFIHFLFNFHHAAMRFRLGFELGKIEGLKQAMSIARKVHQSESSSSDQFWSVKND